MRVLTLLFVLMTSVSIEAVEYDCKVAQKLDTERTYSAAQLQRGQFTVRIIETDRVASLSRCSFASSSGKVTCDRYEVDRIANDEIAKIKKYYVFRSQFDVQLFPNLTFVENNGRGGIAFGRCVVVAP